MKGVQLSSLVGFCDPPHHGLGTGLLQSPFEYAICFIGEDWNNDSGLLGDWNLDCRVELTCRDAALKAPNIKLNVDNGIIVFLNICYLYTI